ncbi:MAG TPA: DNA-3-methyladenine glycosylase I [Bacteroidales bacterium]|nr:DNA-3-methyladenine glycosylase I [Bacteroidales bacterium]
MESSCTWPGNDPLMNEYHDKEWGVPVHDDRKLFEFLVLDAFQAGLSWKTILHRREGFRRAFLNFDAAKIAAFGEDDYNRLLNDSGIIRNRAKIRGTIKNAQMFLKVQKEFGSFDSYIWQFTDGKTIVNHFVDPTQIPTTSPESDAMSKDMKKRGFTFCGSTICYAFMQAAGMVDDHLEGCFRKDDLRLRRKTNKENRTF